MSDPEERMLAISKEENRESKLNMFLKAECGGKASLPRAGS